MAQASAYFEKVSLKLKFDVNQLFHGVQKIKFPICFAHENIKKIPSMVGYFSQIEEISPCYPDYPNGPKLQIHEIWLTIPLSYSLCSFTQQESQTLSLQMLQFFFCGQQNIKRVLHVEPGVDEQIAQMTRLTGC